MFWKKKKNYSAVYFILFFYFGFFCHIYTRDEMLDHLLVFFKMVVLIVPNGLHSIETIITDEKKNRLKKEK